VKPILIQIVISFCFGSLFGQQNRVWSDINYADDTLTGHLLDIYLPETGDGPFPVVVTIAGSAWFANNSKDRAYNIGKSLQKEGFAIVAVNHRSSREAIFPAQINDIKAAVRFIRANAGKYSLDTRFFGIAGDSSGGHLAAFMGTSGGVWEYTIESESVSIEGAVGNHLNHSSRIDAVVDWYGPTTFQVMDSCGSSFSHDAPDSPESTLIGGPIQEKDALCALANPITYIDSTDPAFLILHGDADPLVPYCQSILLHNALETAGVSNKLIIVPGGGHGNGMWIEKYIDEMIQFFKSGLEMKLK
jgi:acetyl esterase/lipase